MNIRKKVGIVLACVFGMAVVINTLFHIYSSDWTENCDTQSAELLNSVRNPSFEELASRLVLEETDGQTPKIEISLNWMGKQNLS